MTTAFIRGRSLIAILAAMIAIFGAGNAPGDAVAVELPPPPSIPPGYDIYTTTGATLNLGGAAGLNLPPDFFGPGSQPPAGPLELVGAPLGGVLGNTDTVIQRITDTSPVDIEIVEMKLASSSPLPVSFDDGTIQDWQVSISLSSTPSTGTLDVFPTDPSGGFLAFEFSLFPLFTFNRVGSTDNLILDSATDPIRFPLLVGSSALFSTSCPDALQVNDPVSGINTTPTFCPGTSSSTGDTSPIGFFDIGGMMGGTVIRTQASGSSITIVKETTSDNAQEFSFFGDLGEFKLDDDAETALPNSITFPNLQPGTYKITESVPDGWLIENLLCDEPSQDWIGNLISGTLTVELHADEDVVCTFTNTPSGTITIIKNVVSVQDEVESFDFESDSLGNFTLTDDSARDSFDSRTFTSVLPGVYTVYETFRFGQSDWILADIVCDDPTGNTTFNPDDYSVSIDVAAGEHVTCTFINEQLGKVTIIKDAVPDSPQDFHFRFFLFNIVLDDDDDPTRSNFETFERIPSGTHTIIEEPTPGWRVVGIDCTDPTGDSFGDLASGTATVTLEPGEEVSCFFANEEFGVVSIIKLANPDDPQDFEFTGDLGTFTLDDDPGSALPDFHTDAEVVPGIYEVSESPVPGWQIPKVDCVDTTLDSTFGAFVRTATIVVSPGDRVTCVFTNMRVESADADGDGFDSAESGGDDCDDNNADIHPGATEFLDGLDNDCDGLEDGFLGLEFLQDFLHPFSQGLVPAAVLGSGEIEITEIDIQSVLFGANNATPAHGGHIEDVNGDGIPDLVLHFRATELVPDAGDGTTCLRFETGESIFEMCDRIVIIAVRQP